MGSEETSATFAIRQAGPDDSEAIEQLFIDSPDEGAISFAPRFPGDAYEAYMGLRTSSTGFVAEADSGRLAGVGFVSLTRARFGGEIRPAALLNAVAVRPAFRGQGLAKRIARHRIEYARDRLGDECVAFANIQHGNAASEAVAESWADDLTAEFRMYPGPPIEGTPGDGRYDVHEAEGGELDDALAASNRFHADAEVYRPWDAETFERLREGSPIDEPLHRYVVATAGGDVVAGVVAMDVHRVMRLVVESLLPELADSGELPAAIPESRELRMTMLSDMWHGDGHADAARALWGHLRATAGGANRIMLNYDPDGPIGDALDIDPAGAMELSVAVSGAALEDTWVAPVF